MVGRGLRRLSRTAFQKENIDFTRPTPYLDKITARIHTHTCTHKYVHGSMCVYRYGVIYLHRSSNSTRSEPSGIKLNAKLNNRVFKQVQLPEQSALCLCAQSPLCPDGKARPGTTSIKSVSAAALAGHAPVLSSFHLSGSHRTSSSTAQTAAPKLIRGSLTFLGP